MRTRIALPGTLLILFGYYATGQEITATISGRVTDPSGAVVPGATITVVSTDKAVTVRSLRTSGGGGIVYAQTGLSLTVNGVHIDPAGLGLADFGSQSLFSARPDQLGDANAHAAHTVGQWFDASLFADPPVNGIRPGNARRGSILGPGAWRWDASLFKNTAISERVNVQFRAEATNVLNHTNFDQIGTLFLFDPIHFGQVVSARDPRTIQLGLKVVF